MKKLNNKGFSLIELLIAVAVMTILITPIISQLFTTVKVSSEAKEKQYVVDSVDNVLENFRNIDENKIKPAGDPAAYVDPIIGKIEKTGTYNVTCNLYLADGTDTTKTVTYSQTNYSLAPIGLGISKSKFSDKTNYNRTVIKNDLNNKLAEKGYQIDYSITNSNDAPTVGGSKLDWRSDNTVGTLDANECYTKLVVKSNAGGIQKDPNTISVSNLQNIDASSMAIIESDATTLDYQIEKDISALLTKYAIDPDNASTTIGKLADDPKALNDYIKGLINNPFSIDKSRSIHLTVTGGTVDANDIPQYYNVRCEVVYRIAFKGTGSDVIKPFNNNTSVSGTFSYPVLDRKYYTDKPTNVYLVYEPLLLSTKSGSTTRTYYADRDYIDITTDEYTDGTSGTHEKSAIYLIASHDNWAKKTTTPTDKLVVSGINYNMYRTYFSGYRDVKIVVSNTALSRPIDIYTNIGVPFNDATGSYKKDAHTYYGEVENAIKRQFDNFNNPALFSDKPTVFRNYQTDPTVIMSGIPYGSYDASNDVKPYDHILPYYGEDVTDEGRLYQVTVVYENKSSNEKTYITGAKGAN